MTSIIPALLLTTSLLHASASSILGKVGDIEIRSTEMREIVAGLDAQEQAALAKDPSVLSQYVRALLVQRLVLQQAKEQKWDEKPEVISQLVRARESAITESFLQQAATPEDGYPNEEELTAAYEANQSKLTQPRSFKLAQIYIASDSNKLANVTKQLSAKKADFAEIARNFSEEATSAAQNGEIGWLSEEQIQAEIRDKLPKLTIGSVTESIKLADGWHIIKLLDIRKERTLSLDEVRSQLTTQLRAERTRLKRQEYLANLLQKHPLAINEIELNQVTAKP